MRAISLFSGCGGSDLGAKRAGVDIVFANDSSPLAAQTYREHKALLASEAVDVRWGDIRAIRSFPSCEILIGCYPCQSFTMGGPRSPKGDWRSTLYREFFRCLKLSNPLYFVAENVAGMQWLENGEYLKSQIEAYQQAGKGYLVSVKLLDAKDYGVPADRKRIFIVGVRQDVGACYWFPSPTHGPRSPNKTPYASHGEAIKHLPLHPAGEYYDSRKPDEWWWYMSRNRKRPWDAPSYTIVGNWRHVTLHPASPTMELVTSDLANKFKQVWKFTQQYDHLAGHPERMPLPEPRRLSWRECAALQTFPSGFEPVGSVEAKFRQIGNAVPPKLMEAIIGPITSGTGLRSERPPELLDELAPSAKSRPR